MWWQVVGTVLVGAASYAAKRLLDSRQPAPAKPRRRGKHHHGLKYSGSRGSKMVLVIGRTGAGKSSLINLLSGKQSCPTSPVHSTTRWLQGVRVTMGKEMVVFLDTPGLGEAFTHDGYRKGVTNWFLRNSRSVGCVVLVLQADCKAHAEDQLLLRELQAIAPRPTLIVLNQIDKIEPIDDPLPLPSWDPKWAGASAKGKNVLDKINEVVRQFGRPEQDVLPVVACPRSAFNREKLIRQVLLRLGKADQS